MSHPRRRLAAGFCAGLIAAVGLIALAGSAGAAGPSTVGAGEEQEEAVAKLVIIEPAASIRREGKTEFKEAKDGAKLRVGDTIQTDGTGFVEIRYTDDSFTRLDVNTTFTILSLTDDAGNRKINGSLESGAAWNRTSALTESESFEQEGAGATAAVVGSAFLFECDGAGRCVATSVVDGLKYTSVDGEVQFLDPLEQCDASEVSDTDTNLCDEPVAVPPEALGAFAALNLYLDTLEGLPGPITGTINEVEGDFVVTVDDPPAAEQEEETPPPSGPSAACAIPPSETPIAFDGSPGTGAPPSTLGTCAMTAFGADSRAILDSVSSVEAPSGDDVTFDMALEHRSVPGTWSTWSHGYTGDVYFVNGSNSLTMTLPDATFAFSFYVEPNNFSFFDFIATTDDGTTSGAVSVTGSAGATYFGFYSTAAATPISSVTVNSTTDSWAIGEFTISQG